MRSASNMRCDWNFRFVVITCVAMVLCSCAGSAPADDAASYAPPTETKAESSSSSQTTTHPVTTIAMTYQNEASTLKMTLDPNDENLNIQMSRSQWRNLLPSSSVPAQAVAAPRKDTVYISSPAGQTSPAAINVQAQLPRDSLRSRTDTVKVGASPDEVKAQELKWAEVSDEVMADLHRAQEYFYKQDYSSALRLVKSAQEKRPTAEGFALQGSIHYMLGDKGAARFFWTEALNLKSDMPDVVQALSKLDQAQGTR